MASLIFGLLVLALGLGVAAGAATAKRSSGSLSGAGSSFVYPLVSLWVGAYKSASINYNPIGSGGGIDNAGAVQLTNVTLAYNSVGAPSRALVGRQPSPGVGGGMLSRGDSLLNNTLVGINSGGDVAGPVAAASAYNLVVNGSGMSGMNPTNTIVWTLIPRRRRRPHAATACAGARDRDTGGFTIAHTRR